MSGEVNAIRDEENDALLSLADRLFNDSLATLAGDLPPAAAGELGTELAGDGYLGSGLISSNRIGKNKRYKW
jgi:hypothetical protein